MIYRFTEVKLFYIGPNLILFHALISYHSYITLDLKKNNFTNKMSRQTLILQNPASLKTSWPFSDTPETQPKIIMTSKVIPSLDNTSNLTTTAHHEAAVFTPSPASSSSTVIFSFEKSENKPLIDGKSVYQTDKLKINFSSPVSYKIITSIVIVIFLIFLTVTLTNSNYLSHATLIANGRATTFNQQIMQVS